MCAAYTARSNSRKGHYGRPRSRWTYLNSCFILLESSGEAPTSLQSEEHLGVQYITN